MKYFNSKITHGLSYCCNVVLDKRNAENKSSVDTSVVLPIFPPNFSFKEK